MLLRPHFNRASYNHAYRKHEITERIEIFIWALKLRKFHRLLQNVWMYMYIYYWHKVLKFWYKFAHTRSQVTSSEQKSILTIVSCAFILKIHSSYVCLLHNLPKWWCCSSGPEVHIHEDSFSFYLLPIINSKFQWTTFPGFNLMKLQLIKMW